MTLSNPENEISRVCLSAWVSVSAIQRNLSASLKMKSLGCLRWEKESLKILCVKSWKWNLPNLCVQIRSLYFFVSLSLCVWVETKAKRWNLSSSVCVWNSENQISRVSLSPWVFLRVSICLIIKSFLFLFTSFKPNLLRENLWHWKCLRDFV